MKYKRSCNIVDKTIGLGLFDDANIIFFISDQAYSNACNILFHILHTYFLIVFHILKAQIFVAKISFPKNPFPKHKRCGCSHSSRRCYIFFQSSMLETQEEYIGGLFLKGRRIQSIRRIIMPASNNEASTRHLRTIDHEFVVQNREWVLKIV